jgi:hypothetical protein
MDTNETLGNTSTDVARPLTILQQRNALAKLLLAAKATLDLEQQTYESVLAYYKQEMLRLQRRCRHPNRRIIGPGVITPIYGCDECGCRHIIP